MTDSVSVAAINATHSTIRYIAGLILLVIIMWFMTRPDRQPQP